MNSTIHIDQSAALSDLKVPNRVEGRASLLRRSPVLKHSTHLSDLILYAAGSGERREFAEFRRIVQELVVQIRSGEFGVVNEKIDGFSCNSAGI